MKKEYLSPSIKEVSIEGAALLLDASTGSTINIDKVLINDNDTEITDGGTTDPDEDYSPW